MTSAATPARSPNVADDAALIGPTIRRLRLGDELRQLREDRSLRLQEVAAKLDVAPSTVSRIETGKAPARTSYVYLMLDLYGIEDPDVRRHLGDLAREGQRKGWWTKHDDLLPMDMGSYLGLEMAATHLRIYAAHTIPALLQTADYAAAAWRALRPGLGAKQISTLVEITLHRQEILNDSHHQLDVVMDESVLMRSIGPASVMSPQLQHLLAVSLRSEVKLRIVRLTESQAPLCPPFTLLAFSHNSDDQAACGVNAYGQVTISKRNDHLRALRESFTRLANVALPVTTVTDTPSEPARRLRSFHDTTTA
jgi:transcriptional regulator with XRE-family HTH domain